MKTLILGILLFNLVLVALFGLKNFIFFTAIATIITFFLLGKESKSHS